VDKPFQIHIITPEQAVYQGAITSLIAPSSLGYFGVWANHAPLITDIARGNITLRESAGKTKVFRSKGKGFLEVIKNKATLLLDCLPSLAE
jgi:F-type H+-transporting ATPase subunit epsilon